MKLKSILNTLPQLPSTFGGMPTVIDMGMFRIRAGRFDRSGRSLTMQDYVELPSPWRESSECAMDESILDELFGTLRDMIDVGSRTIAMSLPTGGVDYQMLSLPTSVVNKRDASTRRAVHMAVASALGHNPQSLVTDAWPAPTGRNTDVTSVGVAASKSQVDQLMTSCTNAGLWCGLVGVSAEAVVRAVTDMYKPEPDDVWAILDLGYGCSQLILGQGSHAGYVRLLSFSGRNTTQRLCDQLQLDNRSAERLKSEYGINPSDRNYRAGADAIGQLGAEQLPGLVYTILRPALEDLCGQIERSFAYALQTYKSNEQEKLYLCGGQSCMPGLADWLHESMGVSVEVFDPPGQRIAPDLQAASTSGAQLATLWGLALLSGEQRW